MIHSNKQKYIFAMTTKIPEKLNACLEIYHEKIYKLLSIFIKYVGGCHRKRPSNKYDASANLKFMNWLLSDPTEYTNYEQERNNRLLIKHKLRWLISLLQKCNGDINYIDIYGQSILFIFLAKYMISWQSSKKEELFKITDVIVQLLQEGASVNLTDVERNTPLHIAVKQQTDTSIVKMLLENFTEVNTCDRDENTVLHILLKDNKYHQDHTECISILVSKGTNIHKPNKQGSTAVHLAVERCNVEALRIFEKRENTNFSLIRKCGRTMLHLACDDLREKSSDRLREATIDLLINHGCDINATDKDGYVPLHYAAKHCSTRIIMKLIDFGADKLSLTKKYGYTPLHLAAQRGRLDTINTLIKIDVNANVVAKGGITPLHLALLYREWSVEIDTIKLLIQNDADVHRREEIFNFTPMHMAVFASGSEIKLLIKNGANVNVMNERGITPLHLASILGNVEVVKVLIDHGANPHFRDRILESTALHWASRRGEILKVNSFIVNGRYLSERKVMMEFWNTLFVRRHKSYYDLHDLIYIHGDKVLHNVSIQADNSIMEMLLKAGAYVNVRDDRGHLPMYYVCKNSNIEGLLTLIEFGGDINDAGIIEVFMEKKVDIEKMKEEEENEKYRKDENKDEEMTREKKKKERNQKKKLNEELLIIILKHLIKFKAANLPIATYYQRYVNDDFLQGFQNPNAPYFTICMDEIEKMKTHMIDNKISVYDLLHVNSNERSIFAQNITTHNLKAKFPEYCNIIRTSCREAIDRVHLLELAKLSLYRISKTYLPDLCSQTIFSYLDNESLRTLSDVSYVHEKNNYR